MTRLEAYQLGDEAYLLRSCAPIFFLPAADAEPETIEVNATVGLVDTGQKNILVTSAHVWTEFQDFKLKNPDARLAILLITNGFGLPEFLDEKLLIDFDMDLDLAVFNTSPNWDMRGKKYFRVYKWPISKAIKGDNLAFLGFAGIGRETSTGIGKFSYSSFGLTITSVSDRKLLMENSNGKNPVFDAYGKTLKEVNLGGMSGSPAYVFTNQGIYRLAGFVQMGATTNDPVFVTHASFLNPDGTLKR